MKPDLIDGMPGEPGIYLRKCSYEFLPVIIVSIDVENECFWYQIPRKMGKMPMNFSDAEQCQWTERIEPPEV